MSIRRDSYSYQNVPAETQEENIETQNGLSYFQACLFATVLEDSLTQLRILMECNNEMRVTKAHVDMPLLLALKYDVEQPEVVDELDGIDPLKLNCMEYKLKKLFDDRNAGRNNDDTIHKWKDIGADGDLSKEEVNSRAFELGVVEYKEREVYYLHYVMIDTYKSLTMQESFEPLSQYVKEIVDRKNHLEFLIQDEAKNRTLRRELNRQYRQQTNHIKSATYDADMQITKLKTQVEDAALNAEIRGRYVRNWQRARTEQNQQKIIDLETGPTRTIEYYKHRTDYEQRVHAEIEMLTSISISETLHSVESWMDKYDTDMEAIDLKIQIKRNEYTNMLNRRIELEETLALHDKEIEDWEGFKKAREEARIYRETMTNAAICVQAWWRGLLVRLQLGPYKVKKTKGKAGKKEK